VSGASRPTGAGQVGTIYLLCFFAGDHRTGRPARYRHAGHYTGWCQRGRLESRLGEHLAGTGARLLQVVQQAGLHAVLVRTWAGTLKHERRLKRQGGAARRCPTCRRYRRLARLEQVAGPESHQDVLDDLELGDGAKHCWGVRWTHDPERGWWALPEPAHPTGTVR
jgi:hypothetical protein